MRERDWSNQRYKRGNFGENFVTCCDPRVNAEKIYGRTGPVAGLERSQHPPSCNFIKVIITVDILTRPQELKFQVTRSQSGEER